MALAEDCSGVYGTWSSGTVSNNSSTVDVIISGTFSPFSKTRILTIPKRSLEEHYVFISC